MATVKTAVSVDKSLFEAAERLARKMKISRSRVFSLALEQLIESRTNQRLLAKLNAAHAEGADRREVGLRRAALRSHRRLIEGDW